MRKRRGKEEKESIEEENRGIEEEERIWRKWRERKKMIKILEREKMRER